MGEGQNVRSPTVGFFHSQNCNFPEESFILSSSCNSVLPILPFPLPYSIPSLPALLDSLISYFLSFLFLPYLLLSLSLFFVPSSLPFLPSRLSVFTSPPVDFFPSIFPPSKKIQPCEENCYRTGSTAWCVISVDTSVFVGYLSYTLS